MGKIITINSDELINNGRLNQWLQENRAFLTTNPNPDLSCLHSKEFIDVELFASAQTPLDWTEKNGKYICYNESKTTIEDVHLIDTNGEIDVEMEEIIRNGNPDKISLKYMIDTLKYIFDREDYNNYMCLEIKNNKLQVAQFQKYDKNKVCFSFPFFKSILINNDENDFDRCFFTFVEISINGILTIAFKVEFSNNKIKYYDYSQNPPHLDPLIPRNGIERQVPPNGHIWKLNQHTILIKRTIA